MTLVVAARVAGGVSLPFGVAAVLLMLGVLDRVAPDQTVGRLTALTSIVCYWCVAVAIVGVVLVWREGRSQFIALCLGVLIAASGMELAVRAFAPHLAMLRLTGVSSSRFHHLYPRNRVMYAGQFGGERVFVRTNEHGFRTDYSRSDFLAHGDRLIVLGDSFTFGLGVRQECAFPAVAESLLREVGGREDVAVLNGGIVSYSPFLHRLVFREVLATYDPQVVILVLDATDIGDDHQYMKEAVFAGGAIRFPYGDGRVRCHGALVEMARRCKPYFVYPWRALPAFRSRLSPGYRYDRFTVEVGGTLETNRFFIYRYPLSDTEPFLRVTLAEVESIARDTAGIGADFMLVVLPRFHQWNSDDCPHNWESDRYRVDEPYQSEWVRFFESARSEVEFDILNLLPALRGSGESDLVFDGDPHLNERGHAFVAARIVEHLLARTSEPAGLQVSLGSDDR